MEYKLKSSVRGTRIITGSDARTRRSAIHSMIQRANWEGYEEIVLPILEKQEVYTDKAGDEILNQMYTFPDKKDRQLCLRPEGTATIQLLADEHQLKKDSKFCYFTPCYRYERPQKGRYREFYQLGLEWINPSIGEDKVIDNLIETSIEMLNSIGICKSRYRIEAADRGFAYYKNQQGFEFVADELGAQKQICGGGAYEQGIGLALGFDRLMLMLESL